jgi:outer membrane protein assembly factor BamB
MNKKFVGIVISMLLFATVSSVAGTVNISEDDFEGFTVCANNDPWAMKGHDPQRTSFSTSDAPDTNDTLWVQELGKIFDPPAVVDDRIYIGVGSGQTYKFCCYDLTGSLIWESDQPGGGAPAVYENKVYIGENDPLYCLDAEDGHELWHSNFNLSVSSPAVADGKVYIGSNDGTFYCLDAEDGDELWNYTTGGVMVASPAVYNDKVYFGSYYDVYCLYANNGTYIWNYPTGGGMGFLGASIVASNEKVYAASDDENVYCLDADTGVFQWNHSIGIYGQIAAAYGNLYIGDNNGEVNCLDANDGSFIWNYTLNSIVLTPAIADGKVYVISIASQNIFCLNATGNGDGTTDMIWNHTTTSFLTFCSPVVANGKVYQGTWEQGENGRLICFGTNEPPEAPDQPDGLTNGYVGVEYTYSVDPVTDPDGDDVFYLFDWGDGTNSGWISTPNASKTWDEDGYFDVKVKVKDIYDAENESEPLEVTIADLEIKEIRGGLGITAVIENIGDTDTANVDWNIGLDGGLILWPPGGIKEDTIASLNAGKEETVKTFVLGIGKVNITAKAGNGEKSVEGFVFGPFVLI